jgi:hypothetical protein
MESKIYSPEPLYIKKKIVEEFTQKVANKLNFHYSDSLSLLVNRLGGEISIGNTGKEDAESGSILINKKAKFKIFISQFTSIERDRFTIAHELGHLFLHYSNIRERMEENSIFRATRYVDANDKQQQVAEREANWFAASLLMPQERFMEIYKQSEEKAEIEFQVSTSAVRIRAKSLGLVEN